MATQPLIAAVGKSPVSDEWFVGVEVTSCQPFYIQMFVGGFCSPQSAEKFGKGLEKLLNEAVEDWENVETTTKKPV